MRRSDLQREENFNEYLRLLQNDDYFGVTYDEKSGGMSAVHRRHKFDKTCGPYGVRRGDYERKAMDVLRRSGFRVVLESELSIQGVKKCDGYLDDDPMEIKSVEGHGTWTVCKKLREAVRQHAESIVLYFPQEEYFSEFRITEGIRLFCSCPESKDITGLAYLLVIVGNTLVACWHKKATPIEGWSMEKV